MANEEKDKANEQKKENEEAGRLGGAGAGIITGAAVGSSILPGVGTVAGAFVGGILGSRFGKKVGGALLDKIDASRHEGTETAPDEKKDLTAELERLARLHKQGVLDDEEFKAAKAALLNL